MIGTFNLNGHDCTQSDLDMTSFLPRDIREDAELRHQVGRSQVLIDDSFADEPVPPEPFDADYEVTLWLSMSGMLDNENEQRNEEIAAWVQARYATEIALNDKIGYTPIQHAEQVVRAEDSAPSFYSCNRTNIRKQHWSDKRSLRESSLTYDKRRGKAHAK